MKKEYFIALTIMVGTGSVSTKSVLAQGYDGIGDCNQLRRNVEYARDIHRRYQKEDRYADKSSMSSKELARLERSLSESKYAVEIAQDDYDMGGCSRGGSTRYDHKYNHEVND